MDSTNSLLLGTFRFGCKLELELEFDPVLIIELRTLPNLFELLGFGWLIKLLSDDFSNKLSFGCWTSLNGSYFFFII